MSLGARKYTREQRARDREQQRSAPIVPRLPHPDLHPADCEHPLCDWCFERVAPSLRNRVRQGRPLEQVCCGCGRGTRSGLVLIADPASVPCQGTAPEPSGAFTW